MPLDIAPGVKVPDEAIELRFVRAGGPGGQNVNKVASAVQLRVEVAAITGLQPVHQARLRRLAGRRLNDDGVLVIAAQRFRTQEHNRRDALERLGALLHQSLEVPKARVATRPTRASRKLRVDVKVQRGAIKKLRRPVGDD